jgi:hypothetical protein
MCGAKIAKVLKRLERSTTVIRPKTICEIVPHGGFSLRAITPQAQIDDRSGLDPIEFCD